MKNFLIILFLLSTCQLVAQFDRIEEPKRLGGSVNTLAEENLPGSIELDIWDTKVNMADCKCN